MKVTVPEEHQLEIRLPQDFPAGPAEIIVLADASVEEPSERASGSLLAALETLRSLELTEEEERVLEDFEHFRQTYPFDLATLRDEEYETTHPISRRRRRSPDYASDKMTTHPIAGLRIR